MQLLKLTLKYKFKGLYNDLKRYLFNIVKFYGTSILMLLGILFGIIFFGKFMFSSDDINKYFNLILPVCTSVILLFYMSSSYTLIIFSKPDIFYLLRNKKLFQKIALTKLIQQNLSLFSSSLFFSYMIAHSFAASSFISTLASFLIIICSFNYKSLLKET